MITGVASYLPYCGVGPAPAELWERWNLDPVLLAVMAGLAALWCLRLGRSGGAGERAALAAGGVVLLVAFVSPLCALASALFSARVAHHALLVAAAAPLLAIALRRAPMAGGLALWTVVHAITLWTWHAPGPYDAALRNDAVYWLMQLTLLAPAVMFWRAALTAPAPAAFAALTAAMMQMGLLGALIAFAGQPLYPAHFTTAAAWGLTPLEDQQAAGVIMWVPAAGVYLAAALASAWAWLGEGERRATAA